MAAEKAITEFIYFSAFKRLIAINRIQNKSFCLHNICLCTVYLLCVYKSTHACIYLRIFLYLYTKSIYNINYININIYM